eukprot:scaffold186161_cov20-Prasinocladus_malaysianus.AAC.1
MVANTEVSRWAWMARFFYARYVLRRREAREKPRMPYLADRSASMVSDFNLCSNTLLRAELELLIASGRSLSREAFLWT